MRIARSAGTSRTWPMPTAPRKPPPRRVGGGSQHNAGARNHHTVHPEHPPLTKFNVPSTRSEIALSMKGSLCSSHFSALMALLLMTDRNPGTAIEMCRTEWAALFGEVRGMSRYARPSRNGVRRTLFGAAEQRTADFGAGTIHAHNHYRRRRHPGSCFPPLSAPLLQFLADAHVTASADAPAEIAVSAHSPCSPALNLMDGFGRSLPCPVPRVGQTPY
jgi:hypothetical protein